MTTPIDDRPANLHNKPINTKINAPTYKLIIDTNLYAGNFERELVAFSTGIIGHCGVGEEHAKLFDQFGTEKWGEEYNDDENHLVAYIEQRTSELDSYPCPRPCSVHTNPEETEYNSICIYFRQKPTQEILDVIKERARLFCTDPEARQTGMQQHMTNQIEILGFRWLESTETIQEYQI